MEVVPFMPSETSAPKLNEIDCQMATLTKPTPLWLPGRSPRSPGGVQHNLLSQTGAQRVVPVAHQVHVLVKAASAGALEQHGRILGIEFCVGGGSA